MTATGYLSLPYRVHEQRPTDEAGIMEHAVEALAGLYADARHEKATHTAEAILDGLHRFRPDLTLGRLRDGVNDLCRLSAEVVELERLGESDEWELQGESWSAVADAARDEYAAALTALATLPVTS